MAGCSPPTIKMGPQCPPLHPARQLVSELRHPLGNFVEVRARYWNGLLLPLMVLQRKVLARCF